MTQWDFDVSVLSLFSVYSLPPDFPFSFWDRISLRMAWDSLSRPGWTWTQRNLPSSTRHGPLRHFAFFVCFLCFASVEVVLQHHGLSSSAWNLHSASLSHLSTKTIGVLHYADSCCRLICQSWTLHGAIIYETHAPREHTQSSGIHNVGL